MAKKTHQRSSSPIVNDRDARLAAEANEWARTQVRTYFDSHRTGFYTPADVLVALDERSDTPPAWLRWLGDYKTRYDMVRNACFSLARKGYVEPRAEKNVLGKDATGFQRATGIDWDVTVTGDGSEGVIDLVTGWLRSTPKAFRGVQAIVITRRRGHEVEHRSTSEVDSERAGQRGRGR